MDIQFYKNLKCTFLLFTCLLLSHISFGQLAPFTLQVNAINETCTANGSLTFDVTSATPGSIVLYSIYKLPNVTTPITVTDTHSYGGLTSGDYQIVALQSSGALSNSQQQVVHINNLIVPVTFLATGLPAAYCGATGKITATVNQGTPVAYEIISGPLIVPPQTSNIFTGLPPGDYDIRVIDACGDGVVQTYHLPVPPPNLSLAVDQKCELLSCTTKEVSAFVTANPGTAIGYPLQVQLTVVPQGQPPLVFTQTLTSGNPTFQTIPFTIPYFNIPSYIASIKITDACGNVKISSDTPLQVQPSMQLGTQGASLCDEQIGIQLCNMLPPYMVEFLSAPAGFNPADFNPNGLGPFTTGPITYASNTQHELPEGHYSIKVTDSCGRTVLGETDVVKAFTDHKVVSNYVGCNLIYTVIIPNQGVPPVTVIMTSAPATYPNTLPQDLTSTMNGGNFFSIDLTIPGTYVFEGVNLCGDNYIRTVTLIPLPPQVIAAGSILSGCAISTGRVTVDLLSGPAIASVVITQAPSTLTQPLPYDVTSFLVTTSKCIVTGLPVGDYTLVVTDVCGTVYPPVTATVSALILDSQPNVQFLRGCALADGSMRMKSANGKYVQVIITAAPAAYMHSLPYDVSFNIDPSGIFYMNTLPEGVYTFHTKDACNYEQDVTITLPGYDILQNDFNIIGNCGSFNLFVNHRLGDPVVHGLWLQKLNPLTGQWVHPLTNVPYVSGTIPTLTNSIFLTNNAINYNIAAYGTFRILKYNVYYSNGRPQFESCYSVLRQFDFTGDLNINSATAVPCNSTSYDVIITAGGIAPFTYKITTKNGQPFVVNNGNSNLFAGLAPGIYNFQVQDLCGNIVNRVFDIITLSEPQITPESLCIGQSGQLSVSAVSFLNYQWWKGNDTANILSTTNVLAFNPFSNTTSPGTYHVRIYSTSPLSCIDRTITYVVPVITTPNAGLDGTITICGSSDPIDLFSILTAPFDAGGTWLETTSSGGLNGNMWTSAGVPYGVYAFQYSVDGLCNQHDSATVIIHYNPAPDVPVITAEPSLCNSESIELQVDTIPNATYEWTGPNGFHSTEQNPSIENSGTASTGLYTVTALLNGCESNASVTITILPLPDFAIKPTCVNNVYTLSVTPIDNSFNTESATYSWIGPNNFSSTENPIPLTGFSPGLYQVTVTSPEGCQETHAIPVSSTVCSISNVITPNNDDTNEDFDLSGLDVRRIEIYSRWGRLVYEQNNYIDQWHGQNMHGKELPDSTYYYILYLGSGEEKQGWVYKSSWR